MTRQAVITELSLAPYTDPVPVEKSSSCLELQIDGWDRPMVLSFQVDSIGMEAYRILQQSRQGKVLAVFSRSVYLQNDQGVFCLGLASIGRGPLQVQLVSDNEGLFAALQPGSLVSLGDVVSPVYCGSVSGMELTLMPTAEHCKRLLRGCEAPPAAHGFGWLIDERAWHDGADLAELSVHGLDGIDRGLRRMSAAAIECLVGWLRESLSRGCAGAVSTPDSQVVALLGAGPGLTPAGDDLLAGVMLALHRLHRGDLAGRLWQVLQPSLSLRTNEISSAHLRMVAQGQCAEPMRLLLEHFINDAPMQLTMHSLSSLADAIGGSTGWDTLAGISLVVRVISNSKDD